MAIQVHFSQTNIAHCATVRTFSNLKLVFIEDGNLLICENCPKVFHLKCIGLTKYPKDDFICPFCKGSKPMECAKCFKVV